MLCCLLSFLSKLALYCAVPPLLVLVVIGVANKLSPRISNIWFSCFFTYVIKPLIGKAFDATRADLFKDIGNLKSADAKLRKENVIRILEIGTGEGANLSHYPNNCRFISVDRNPEFKTFLTKNKKKFPHVNFDKIVVAMGEDFKKHVEDESVDVVVITHVLCSVDDQAAVFGEAHRVLVPGGTLFLMEHVKFYDNQLYFRIQQLMDLVWPVYFGGCRITKDTRAALDKTGFSRVDVRYKLVQETIFPVRPQLVGTATK